ncbi:class I SAM-dependent methyltransferase [Patescibacteria group bacterium]|nr:class I SAM-dependent methyltransferase [Patescibacteria group bacterium]
MKTDNYSKHTSNNPLKKLFIFNFFHVLLSQVKNLKIESVLDAGCGEGFTLNKLRESRIGKTHEGIDYSKEAISLGKKVYPDLHISQGNIYDLKYKSNSFDLVICSEVLEHLEDPQKALKELVRVSKKYIVLSVPNEPWFYLSNYTQWGKDIGHINKWTRGGFRKFVSRNSNLKILSLKTPFPWVVVFSEKLAL